MPLLSRRTVLKGLGVSMCLPLLEAMQPLAALADTAQGKKPKPPVRMAVLYMPNGVHPKAWTPAQRGSDFELSPILAPLSNVKSDLLVLTQLMNKQSIEGDGHYVKVAPFLTGTHITKTTGADLRCGGVSLDQIVAQRLGNLTPLPSLELSIEPVTGYVDANVGYTAIYGSAHLPGTRPRPPSPARSTRSWRSTACSIRRAAQGIASRPRDASVLDAVLDDAKSLHSKIGTADRHKQNEYLDAVRSIETRIAFDAARRAGEYGGDPLARKEIERLGGRIRDYYKDPARLSERGIDHTEQVRLMLDIMVLAFWTDSTRVATFMFANEVSGKNFSFLPGVNGSHHEISHHSNEAAKLEQYQRINIWHTQQYAYMLEKMRGIKEGDGTLLDNSMVMLASGMRDGNAHSPYDLPILLAGRGGGTLATGRHLVYEEKTPALQSLPRHAEPHGRPRRSSSATAPANSPASADPQFQGISRA